MKKQMRISQNCWERNKKVLILEDESEMRNLWFFKKIKAKWKIFWKDKKNIENEMTMTEKK